MTTVQSQVMEEGGSLGREEEQGADSERWILLSGGGVGGRADGVSVSSGADDLILQVSHFILERLEGGRIPHVSQPPADGRAHCGQSCTGFLSCLGQSLLSLLVCFRVGNVFQSG